MNSSFHNLVIYGIVPAQFSSHGLSGVTKKLHYLKKLGINALWLTPIFEHPRRDFGYAVTNYYKIDPTLGTEADFKQLIKQAHKLGIKVFVDFVPNHTSDKHPYYKSVKRMGERSPYYNFYELGQSAHPTHYFNWTNLINLNFSNQLVEQMVIDSMYYWIQNFDVDGFRVDAAWGVKERSPGFWKKCMQVLKSRKRSLFLLAEACCLDQYYYEVGFDAVYDWNMRIQNIWSEVIHEDSSVDVSLLRQHIEDSANKPAFRFINNNDTGPRFVSRYGLHMTQMATTLLLTLPGIPCIFMGDETGAEFDPYTSQRGRRWTSYPQLYDHYQKLIHLRHNNPTLTSSPIHFLDTDSPKSSLAFVRSTDTDANATLVVSNFGKGSEITIEMPKHCSKNELSHIDGISSGVIKHAKNRVTVQLGPLQSALLQY